MRLMILGPPGAGKGTQAQWISKHFGMPHISTGDMLRQAVKSGSELGSQVQAIMKSGQLVPDSTMITLVKDRLSARDCVMGFVLDGFPRTLEQAKALEKAKVSIDTVLELLVPDDSIVERLSGRRVHPASGRTYHALYHPPQREGRDDLTGEALIQREDDKEETIRKRLEVYHQQTKPLVAHYQKHQSRHLHYYAVDGVGDIEEVQREILAVLGEP